MFRNLLPALAIGTLLALVGCSGQPQTVIGQASPASTASPTSAPTAPAYVPPAYTPPTTTAAPAPPVSTAPLKDVSSRDWALIAKSPDTHLGERIIVYGHVTQFDAATGTSGFRANVGGDKRNQWYDYDTNTVLVGTDTLLASVVQGDLFRAEVTVAGSYSYETTMGGTMTVPQLSIDKIDVIGSADT